MNIHCLVCQSLRMEARVKGGCGTPMFFCKLQGRRATHLMPGPQLTCLEPREGETIDPRILEPDHSNRIHG